MEFISHKSILNVISGVQSSVSSTAPPVHVARRDTIAGSHGSTSVFSVQEYFSESRNVQRFLLHFHFALAVSRTLCLL